MASASILIIDDEPDIRELIGEILSDEGHAVQTAADAVQARELRNLQDPDLILLDVWMPDVDGVSLLREWVDSGTLECPVVMISGHGSVETAVEATRLGAFDFLEKPISMAKLLVTVGNALEAGRLRRENAGLRQQLPPVLEPLGRSPTVQQLRSRLERIAAHDSPVLISGEPGVGKRLAARWIHHHSSRAPGPFVVLSSALKPEAWNQCLHGSDQESGALTKAAGGCLYIDDVSRLGAAAQGSLLGLLDHDLGLAGDAGQSRPAVRIITGTSVGLDHLIEAKTFDETLFFRLSVVPLHLPPLRERRDDVPDLVRFYAEYFPNRDGVPYRHFSVAALNRLRQHDWPGNLLELTNLVQQLLVLGGQQEVSVSEVEEALCHAPGDTPVGAKAMPGLFHLPLREAREEFERQYLTFRLKTVEGSVGKLAEAVEMERTHLYRKLRQLGVDPKQF